MAKSSASKKAPVKKQATKAPASYSTTEASALSPSEDNPSRYQHTEDADMDIRLLDPQDGLLKLLVDSVKDLYWAENHLVKALPKMMNAAASKDLKMAIGNHLEETEGHVQRLEQVFDLLGKKPQAKKCDAMDGLTKEGEGVIENTDRNTPARDLAIIMASQKVEHYEISAYAGVGKLAEKLGLQDVANILAETLADEQNADVILAGLADNELQPNKKNKNVK